MPAVGLSKSKCRHTLACIGYSTTFTAAKILDFDDVAARQYNRLAKSRIRIGTMDLKIAGIVLANDAILLSSNSADFGRVPGLHVEDWTAMEK